ncbi:MAG: alpha/beta fold hydrolase [Bdellovibrionales bacterium]
MLDPFLDTIIELSHELRLKSGETIVNLRAAITMYGNKNATAENTILFGHGFSCSSKMHIWWRDFLEQMNFSKYKLICINTLGSAHGSTGPDNFEGLDKNDRIFPPTSIEDQANFYKQVLTEVGIDKVGIVVGASMGGMHALQLYLSYPQMMSKCIVIGATPLPTLIKLYNLLQLRMLNDPRLSSMSKTVAQEYCRILLRLNCISHETVFNENAESYFAALIADAEKYKESFTIESHQHLTATLNDFSVEINQASKLHMNTPIQFISTEGDYYVPEKYVTDLYEKFKKNQYPATYNKFLTKKGHEAWITDGANFAQFIKGHIS